MKKSLMFLLVVFPILLIVSCGAGKKDSETSDTTPDNGTDSADSASDDDADSGDTNPDANDTAPDSEPDRPEKNAEGCYIFTVDGSTFSKYYRDTYLGNVKDNILGDKTLRDAFEIDVFQSRDTVYPSEVISHPGTYDLGSGSNKSYVDCTECVKVHQDYYDETKMKYRKNFFQEKGTLVIESVDSENNIKGKVSAQLVEVTIDPDSGEAVKVEGGECVAIENWAFDTGTCVPDCAGKVCGGDGCGGTCGEGCSGDLACSKDQKSCVPYECEKITFDEFKMHVNEYDDYYYKASVSGNVIGNTELPDIMTFHTYTEDGSPYVLREGTIDLGSSVNANYETCTECLLLYEDADFENNETGRTFFQQKGELVFEEVKEGTFESKGHGSFRLVEVEIDDYTNESVPVPGGACYEVEDLTWDTVCVPHCEEGWQCGSDGCGGECGEGCGKDMMCNAARTQCVEWNCEKITLGNITENDTVISPYEGIYNYNYPVTPNIGDSDEESLQLRLKNIQEKRPYRLYGSNFRSSDVAFTLYVDKKKMYFQHSGEVVFDPFDLYTGKFEATLDSLRLVEITLDEDLTSTPVPGGGCVEIANTSLAYQPSN